MSWIEKYRPDSFVNIIGQKNIIDQLKNYVINRNLPNMVFVGPPGILRI